MCAAVREDFAAGKGKQKSLSIADGEPVLSLSLKMITTVAAAGDDDGSRLQFNTFAPAVRRATALVPPIHRTAFLRFVRSSFLHSPCQASPLRLIVVFWQPGRAAPFFIITHISAAACLDGGWLARSVLLPSGTRRDNACLALWEWGAASRR